MLKRITPTLDADNLRELRGRLTKRGLESATLDLRLEFNEAAVIQGYVKAVLGEERVYPRFLPTQASGRWSVSDPPLTNWTPDIRNIIVPDPGFVWIAFDLDQIEAKIVAAFSHDRDDLDAFDKGHDLHTITACRMQGVPLPPNLKDPHQSPECTEWREKYKWQGKDDIRRVTAKVRYCLTPDHKLLSPDLRWRPAYKYNVGDKILGFDEATYKERCRYREATIEAIEYDTAMVYAVILSSGAVIKTTADHRWLASKRRTNSPKREWVKTSNLVPGKHHIPRLFNVWQEDRSKEAGWLAGILDGEGSIGGTQQTKITISQNPGPILNKIEQSMQRFYPGKRYVRRVKKDARCVALLLEQCAPRALELLGKVRPERLIAKVNFDKLGAVRTKLGYDEVVSVTPVGVATIVKIQTSTGTFIADGYPMHNCLLYGRDWTAVNGSKYEKDMVKLGFKREILQNAAKAFLRSKPNLLATKRKYWEQTAKAGEARTIFGRRRRLFGDWWSKAKEGWNHMVQGSVTDMINTALIELCGKKIGGQYWTLVYPSHDAAKIQIPANDLIKDREIILDIFKRAVEREYTIDGEIIVSTATWHVYYSDGSVEHL